MKRAIKHELGFTLIELMVALTLGIILTLGVTNIFDNSRMLANTETALSRVQEAGRYAMDILEREIRVIGYAGCNDPNDADVTVMAKVGVPAGFGNSSLSAWETTADGVYSPVIAAGDDNADLLGMTVGGGGKPRAGSDVIRIRRAEDSGMNLSDDTGVSAEVKTFDNPAGLSSGDLMMIADCKSVHIACITNTTSSSGGGASKVTFAHASSAGTGVCGGNTPIKIEPGYGEDAKVYTYRDTTFFVADTSRNTPQGDDVYALYRKRVNKPAEELVEGVEYLQLLYGEQVNDTNIRYVKADKVLDFNNIYSIRVGLLIQGFEGGSPQDDVRTYKILDQSISATTDPKHAGGANLRKPFLSLVKLRNKRR